MIYTFSYTRLTNEAHFQHKTETKDILQRYPSLVAMLGKLAGDFVTLLDEEDTVLEYINKSDFTVHIATKDRVRDETTMGLFRHIEADCYHFNPALRQEAIGLQNIKNRYNDLVRRSLDNQTASTYNMLQELNARRDVLERLHLDVWVDQLDAENKAVNELMKDRDTESAAKPTQRMKEVRPQIDTVCVNIYSALETFARLGANTEADECIKEINAVNKRYDDNLAKAAGQRAARKQAEKPDETTAG